MVNLAMTFPCLAHLPNVLLGNALWQKIGQQFRNRGAEFDSTGLLWLICGVLVFVAFLWFVSKWKQREQKRPYYSRLLLFRELCAAHRLRWGECWLLWRLARGHLLRQPAALFVNPDFFSPQNVPTPLQAYLPELERLRQQLFQPQQVVEPEAEPTATGPS